MSGTKLARALVATTFMSGVLAGTVAESSGEVSAAGCGVKRTRAGDGAIRSAAGPNAPQIGVIHSGETLPSACTPVTGGWYAACGGDNRWVGVARPGLYSGWVAYNCVQGPFPI